MQRPADDLWKRLVTGRSGANLPPGARRLRQAIIILGALLVVGAVGVGAINATSQSEFCATCHEMSPEYVTWQASSHSQVECIDCHVGPGWTNLLKDKVNALRQVYGHVTGNYAVPITLPHPIADDICQECHTPERQIKQQGELLIPHDRHQAAGVNCLSCHQGIAHAQVSVRGLTADADWESWSPARGREEVQPQFTTPRMETCISCHQERGVPVSCNTCHTAISAPAGHSAADWVSRHGPETVANFQSCVSCHRGTDPLHPVKDVKELARVNELCATCHSQRPAGHTTNWIGEHKDVVAKQGMEDCLVCHDLQKEEVTSPGQVYCDQCHQF